MSQPRRLHQMGLQAQLRGHTVRWCWECYGWVLVVPQIDRTRRWTDPSGHGPLVLPLDRPLHEHYPLPEPRRWPYRTG